ncbi:NlpC/P60 family protein [Maribacter algarum]|uniref:NlpC/P60 family protein n=1 Tax=Maribacter algarum (ex Zhang et al. 2020) TaxID=2578118 RepID=A0A5S3PVG7_9FLAO|nr:NlpC/P60 family protein [Maribacter algarum]TMM59001.1 NlpC/P60 family protein [Maribacter algarum]
MKKFFTFVLIIVFFGACAEKQNKEALVNEILAIKTKFAPDKRVALFDISAAQEGGAMVLKGETNLPDAVNALMEKLNAENIAFVDSIQLLPSKETQGKTYGLINNSVSNLRSNPKHSGELATQATLGTPVKIYKTEGDWYYIQTPDKYLSWVDGGGIVSLTDEDYKAWKSSEKVIYTKTYGHSYIKPDADSQVVTDLVAGGILEFLNEQDDYYAVKYPDGRIGYVSKKESQPYAQWIATMNPSGESLLKTSKTLMGVPYLWGGTSSKGMDCSGFTKTIYFLNGMVIPRDASQQVHTGKQIDENRSFENLEKGDLLFFGRKATDSAKERVVHVGMWIGNNEFIHASNQVRVSSIDRNAENFDEFNLNRYLRSKRILKEEDKDLIDLKQTSVFK